MFKNEKFHLKKKNITNLKEKKGIVLFNFYFEHPHCVNTSAI